MAAPGHFQLNWDGFPAGDPVKRTRRILRKDEAGVTAIEYGLIAALIAVVVITALSLVGTHLSTTLNTIATKL
jgi:pilus assembly protein Flp/PilA